MRIKAVVQVNGNPLRRAYVEHMVFGVGTEMYMTDDQGRVRDGDFDEGVDSLTSTCDLRVICQNTVLRVLNGGAANLGVYQDRAGVRDGDVINLNTQSEQDDWFAILNRAQLAYQVVFRPLGFFANQKHPDFPLGRKSTLRATRDQARRVELSYPDGLPQPLAFVEPARLPDGYPLMHIKLRSSDGRLFGERDALGPQAPTLLPHELTHALHFASMSDTKRIGVSGRYANFLVSDMLAGGTATHSLGKRTTAEVAYVEAGGHFGQAFMEFVRAQQGGGSTLVRPERTPITPALQQQFAEVQFEAMTGPAFPPLGTPAVPPVALPPGTLGPLHQRDRHLKRVARFTGGDREGAVYAAIFTDFAQAAGLDLAASAYFEADALTFGEYRDFIHRRFPQLDAALESARVFWGL